MEIVLKYTLHGFIYCVCNILCGILIFTYTYKSRQECAMSTRGDMPTDSSSSSSLMSNKSSDLLEDSGERWLNFENFDNKQNGTTTSDSFLVPNIVHLIYLKTNKLRFHNMVCLYSIYLNQRPDLIVIHCENCSMRGLYWQKVMNVTGLRSIIRLRRIDTTRTIFASSIGFIHHRFG